MVVVDAGLTSPQPASQPKTSPSVQLFRHVLLQYPRDRLHAWYKHCMIGGYTEGQLVVRLKVLASCPLLRLMAVALVVALLPSIAWAQHRPWTGFYAGVHGGYHWGAGDSTSSLLPDLATWLSLSPDYGQFQGRYDSAADGVLGGAQVGYGWRSGTLVFGFEADLSRLNADGSETRVGMVTQGLDIFPVRTYNQQEVDWLGTVRGRVGFLPFDDQRLLVYVTGGLAYGRVRTSHSFIDVDLDAGFVGSSSGWEVGGTVGAGLEWALGRAWTLKAEYLYYDLGERSVEGAQFNNASPFGFDARYDLNGHIARVGLNYQLGGY